MGVPKLSQFGLPGLWQLITPSSNLRSRWGLKQTCSSPWELFNSVSHSACTHRGRVDSRLLVVGSQIVNLTPGLSFVHNLCCRCPNGPCEAIFDIYASRPFQRYKEHLKARCFDPYNRVLNFWESYRTPKSPFRECECHPDTPSKWGCDNPKLKTIEEQGIGACSMACNTIKGCRGVLQLRDGTRKSDKLQSLTRTYTKPTQSG